MPTLEERIAALEKRVKAIEDRGNHRREPTVVDLKDILEAKVKLAQDLKDRYCSVCAASLHWDSRDHQIRYTNLLVEIKGLRQRIASMDKT